MKIDSNTVSIPQVEDYREDVDIRKMMLKDEVAAEILNSMDQKGISKSELSKRLKTSLSNVSQILNGHRNLTLETICEISMALKTDVQINFADTFEKDTCHGVVFYEQYVGLEGYANGPLTGVYSSSLQGK